MTCPGSPKCQWWSPSYTSPCHQPWGIFHSWMTARGYTQGKATNHQHLAGSVSGPSLWAALSLPGGSCPPPVTHRGPPGCQGSLWSAQLIAVAVGGGRTTIITASRNHKWLCKDDIRSARPGTAAFREVVGRRQGLEPGPGDRDKCASVLSQSLSSQPRLG